MKKISLLRLITITSIGALFAGCQKEATTTTKPNNEQISAAPSFSGKLDTAQLSKNFYISNCGLATLPTPAATSTSPIKGVGTILAVNQPAGETPIPSSILFGGPNSQGNPKYTFVMQGDANLVLYLTGTSTSLWSSRSATGGANKHINCYLVLQGDGNLIIKVRETTGALTGIWTSNKILCPGQQPPVLVFQGDGNIVEEYPCAHIGNNTYGFIGNTGTGGGTGSNHSGSF
jgi:hypothetical protein